MILKADPNAIDINKISLNDPLEPQEIEVYSTFLFFTKIIFASPIWSCH